jgi:hypothetical protein
MWEYPHAHAVKSPLVLQNLQNVFMFFLRPPKMKKAPKGAPVTVRQKRRQRRAYNSCRFNAAPDSKHLRQKHLFVPPRDTMGIG